jgi:hypothetical protein
VKVEVCRPPKRDQRRVRSALVRQLLPYLERAEGGSSVRSTSLGGRAVKLTSFSLFYRYVKQALSFKCYGSSFANPSRMNPYAFDLAFKKKNGDDVLVCGASPLLCVSVGTIVASCIRYGRNARSGANQERQLRVKDIDFQPFRHEWERLVATLAIVADEETLIFQSWQSALKFQTRMLEAGSRKSVAVRHAIFILILFSRGCRALIAEQTFQACEAKAVFKPGPDGYIVVSLLRRRKVHARPVRQK